LKVVRLSAINTGRFLPQEIFVALISVGGRIDPRAIVRPEGYGKKVNQSYYRSEVPRGFQEVKVPRLHNNGPEWW